MTSLSTLSPLQAAQLDPHEVPAFAGTCIELGDPAIHRTASRQQVALTPARMADFLESLQVLGNVGIACQRAGVARQTAYRARRRSAGFARAWDAALVAARTVAEAELADRAINGVDEAVYYHGEEVARRRRYDSRLLLAHLARLDKAAERLDVAATLPVLDEQIDALRALGDGAHGGAGEAEAEVLAARVAPEALRQAQDERDMVADPNGFAERERLAREIEREAEERTTLDPAGQLRSRQAQGERGRGEGENPSQDTVTPVTPCPDCGGRCLEAEEDPEIELTEDDCMWLDNRLIRMEAVRPSDTPLPCDLPGGDPDGVVAMRQLAAFEAGQARWWEIVLPPAEGEEPAR